MERTLASPKGRAKYPLSRLRRQLSQRESQGSALYWRTCISPRLPLVTKGSCRRRRLKGSERCSLQSATLWCGKTCNFSSLPSRLRRATSPCSPRGGFGVCLSALVRTYLRGRTARAGQNPAHYAIGVVFAGMYRFTNNSQCKVLTLRKVGGTLRLALRDDEC